MFDDILLISFILGLILIISSFFKYKVKDKIDDLEAFLQILIKNIKEFITKLAKNVIKK
ncbi:MAG: hypothetical protein O8C63_01405 [Candidatus Methanoperedens sp.]|nr:hypothetical protein [Candidatus Methanoperedens sp.]